MGHASCSDVKAGDATQGEAPKTMRKIVAGDLGHRSSAKSSMSDGNLPPRRANENPDRFGSAVSLGRDFSSLIGGREGTPRDYGARKARRLDSKADRMPFVARMAVT